MHHIFNANTIKCILLVGLIIFSTIECIPVFYDMDSREYWWVMYYFFVSVFSFYSFACSVKDLKLFITKKEFILFIAYAICLFVICMHGANIVTIIKFLSFFLFYISLKLFRFSIEYIFLVAISIIISSVILMLHLLWGSDSIFNDDKTHYIHYSLILSLGIASVRYILMKFKSSVVIKRILYFIFALLILFIILIESRIGLLMTILSFTSFYRRKTLLKIGIPLLIITFLMFVKKHNSTEGRAFIYQTSISMIPDIPTMLRGQGDTFFEQNYMHVQANKLKYKKDDIAILADNITHPLSEYIYVIINYGGISLIVSMATLFFVLNIKKNIYVRSLVCVLLLYSLFSYPFKYPISWIVLVICLVLSSNSPPFRVINTSCHVLSLIFGIALFTYALYDYRFHHLWNKALNKEKLGMIDEAYNYYDVLYHKHIVSDMFLYNYSHFLNKNGYYSKAISVSKQICVSDYETEMLKGDIYLSCKQYNKSILHYKIAAQMCPNRFLPLYGMYIVYKKNGDNENCNRMSEKILNKKIKVPSVLINQIKEAVK